MTYISKYFYSNCLIEAIKAKIKHPIKVKIKYIPARLNEVFCPHLKQRQERDKIKNQYALDNNIDLIRIPYWERDNITIDYILGNKFLIKENC